MVQIFVRDNTTTVYDVCLETMNVMQLMTMIEDRIGLNMFRQRLLYGGMQLDHNKMLNEYNIQEGSTLQLNVRITQQIYVNWCGKWLEHNFWYDLTKNNLINRSVNTLTIENLTVYHLKKILSKYLLLKPHEISVSYYNESHILDDNELLENNWTYTGRDFYASIINRNDEN